MNCVYCGESIIEKNTSREHIIQNALGGLYESTCICCKKCNKIVESMIDSHFCKIFAPVIGRIKDIKKTNDSSMPSYSGKAIYLEDGKIYDVKIKDRKVIDCIEAKKLYKKNLAKSDFAKFIIDSYYFELDNRDFKNGLCKIAFNYAIEKGVPKEEVSNNLNIEKHRDKIIDISFDFPITPFVPQNAFDSFLELDTDLNLSHGLILFSFDNYLICYIDIFNTFQYYVILSQKWSGEEIYKSYFQKVEKMDRVIPKLNIRRLKDIDILSKSYNVEATTDIEKLKKDIEGVIKKKPYAIGIDEYISSRMSLQYEESQRDSLYNKAKSINFYMDEDDNLKSNLFRRFTPCIEPFDKNGCYFYPTYIQLLIDNGLDCSQYTNEKFHRLNRFLCKK